MAAINAYFNLYDLSDQSKPDYIYIGKELSSGIFDEVLSELSDDNINNISIICTYLFNEYSKYLEYIFTDMNFLSKTFDKKYIALNYLFSNDDDIANTLYDDFTNGGQININDLQIIFHRLDLSEKISIIVADIIPVIIYAFYYEMNKGSWISNN